MGIYKGEREMNIFNRYDIDPKLEEVKNNKNKKEKGI